MFVQWSDSARSTRWLRELNDWENLTSKSWSPKKTETPAVVPTVPAASTAVADQLLGA